MYHSKTALAAAITGTSSALVVVMFHLVKILIEVAEPSAYSDPANVLGILGSLIPYLMVLGLAFLLGWIGFGTRSRGCMIAAAVTYCVAVLISFWDVWIVITPLVLCIIASTKRMKNNRRDWLGYHPALEELIDDDDEEDEFDGEDDDEPLND